MLPSQNMLQCESTSGRADERATRRDDEPLATCDTRLVSEQTLQRQEEDDRTEIAATSRKSQYPIHDTAHKTPPQISKYKFPTNSHQPTIFYFDTQEGRKIGYGSMPGIPLIASSPVRHDSPLNLHGLEVTSYQPPWKALSDFALHSDLDHNGVINQTPAFQNLVNQVRAYPVVPC